MPKSKGIVVIMLSKTQRLIRVRLPVFSEP